MKRLVLALLAAAVPAALYWALRSPLADDVLLRRLPQLAAAAGLEAEASGLDFDPWGPSLSVRDLRAAPADGSWGFSARSVRVRLHFLRTLSGTAHLDLEAEAPRFEGTLRASGKEGGGPGGRDLLPVVFERLSVSEGSARVELPSANLRVEAPSVEVGWSVDRGSARLTGASLTWLGATERVESLEFEGRRRYAAVDVDRLELVTDHVRLRARGRAGPWRLLDLDVEGEASFAGLPAAWTDALRLTRFAPLRGELQVRAEVRGSTARPDVKGSVSLEEAGMGSLTGGSARAEWRADGTGVGFSGLEFRSSVGGGRGFEGRLSWKDGLSLEARGEAVGYDLRAFMGLLRTGWFPVGVQATGSVEAIGTLAPELALRCRVDAEATGLDVTPRPGEAPVFELPRARVASRLTVGRDETVFGPTRVDAESVSVAVSSGRIEYRTGLWLDTDVAVRNLGIVRRYVPEGFDASGAARGRFGGPYAGLVFEYDLDLDRAVVLGEEAGRVEGAVRYDLRDLTVEGLSGEGPLGSWSAEGKVGLRRDGRWDVAARWSHADLAGLRPLLERRSGGRLPDVAGDVSVSGRLEGALAAPVFAGTLSSGTLAAGRVRLTGLEAEGSVSRDGWTLRRGRVGVFGGEVSASGTGGSGGLQAAGEARGIALPEVARLAGREIDLQGTASGEFQVSGPYAGPSGLAGVRFSGLSALGWPVGEVAVSLRATPDSLEGEATAFGAAATLRAEASREEGWPFRADLDLRALPWGALPPAASVEGLEIASVTARAQCSGRGADFRGSLEGAWSGALDGVRWRWADLGTVNTGGRFGAGGLGLFAEAWEGEARLDAEVPAAAAEPVAVRVLAKDLRLSRFRAPVPLPDGRADLRAEVLVSRHRWASEEGLRRLAAVSGLRLEGKTSPLVLPGGAVLPPWSLRGETVAGNPRVELSTEGLYLEGSFRDLAAGEWEASFRSVGFEPARLAPAGHALSGLRGVFRGEGRAEGTLRGVRTASASGRAEGLAWGLLAPGAWEWSAAWDGGALAVRAREPRGVGVEARWSAGEGVEAVLDADRVKLREWLAHPGIPAQAEGEVSGRVEARLPAGGTLSATARFPSLRLSFPPVLLENRDDVRLSYEAGRFAVDRFSLGGEILQVDVRGGGGSAQGWELEATAEGDLSAARYWSRRVRRASGRHRLAAQVRGPWKEPRVSGSWEVASGGRLLLEGFGLPIEDLDAAVVLDPSQGIRIRWIDAQVGTGRAHVEGQIGVEGVRPSKLRLSAELRDIRYEWPPQVSYGFDVDLLLTGTAERPELRGDLRLEEFLYARRLNLKTLTLELLKPRARAVPGMPVEGGKIFVDLAIGGSGDLRAENNLADVLLGVDLRARGYLPKPVLWGRVEVLEGTVRARGVEYAMKRSAVEFLGETRPAPLLDVHASTTVQQYDISVDVTGPLDEYQVLLSSLPPLPENDIVALLSLGATTGELPDAEALTAVQAASYATGGLQDDLEEGVGEFLGIDQLSVDPSYSAATQTTLTRITVGKAITRSLFARYSAAMGGVAEQDLEVQYNLAPRISLLGTWTDRAATTRSSETGSLGGEIRFRFPFR